jgi:tetratricopeptide (TPR) repeat protein
MSKKAFLLAFAGAALLWAGRLVYLHVTEFSDLSKFAIALLVGSALGVLAAYFLLPRFSEAVVRFLFSWNDPPDDPCSEPLGQVAVLIAQGDFAGAIAECEAHFATDPTNAFALAEMARIYAERMDEPERAIVLLLERLAARDWSVNDAAYLRFRLADIQLLAKDTNAAEHTLEGIIAAYPGTRHSGTAHHRLHQLRPKVVPMVPAAWGRPI